MNTMDLIREFLSQKRFAMIGVSRQDRDISRALFGEFRRRGYDVVPVNPYASTIGGVPSVPEISHVHPKASAALIMLPGPSVKNALAECAGTGVGLVWVYGVRGEKDIESEAMAFAQRSGLKLIAGECPFMFLPNTGLVHRIHARIWQWIGKYPA